MTSIPAPMCYSCAHLNQGEDDPLSCTAFPEGIPAGILESRVDHRYSYGNDNGIVFEQDPSLPEPRFDLILPTAPEPPAESPASAY